MFRILTIILIHFQILPSISALDFLFNSFNATTATALNLTGDARVEPPVIRFINDSNQLSIGGVFYPARLPMRRPSNSSRVSTSFSTQFVFSILPDIRSSPGFGLCFFLSATTSHPGALSGQYFGIFSNATVPTVAPLVAVEFDTGINPEFNDPNDNHIGVDLNSVESVVTQAAGYYNSTGGFVPVDMRNGQNIHAWIEFDGPRSEINVSIAPAGTAKPSMPSLSYRNPIVANYVSADMFVGFSASKTRWVEARRLLAWSLSDVGVSRAINTTNLPVFRLPSGPEGLSPGSIAGITIGCVAFVLLCPAIAYWLWQRSKSREDEEIEEWELQYWPHRFSYEELSQATKGFSKDELLGAGGFGKVYRGRLAAAGDNSNGNKLEVAVKCVSHDSKQGVREFMAEISSMGRLQHKNLVQMRGWCRKGNELMLVYDYMPNGSLNTWIFDKPMKVMGWEGRRRVIADVAEGLEYLHHGWDQVVVHRDIKSSNILLDDEMRGRLGDFGLAKLYTHGEVPGTTRVVGTLGYLAPELATVASPTSASDVYSFGVVVMEVACGRRPIETRVERDEESVLVEWVREKYGEGRLWEVGDQRIKGEFKVDELEGLLKVGLGCTHPSPDRRPTMKEVVAILVGRNDCPPTRDLLLVESRSVDNDDHSGSGGVTSSTESGGANTSPTF